MSAYVTTKWAVHGFARTLQVEARRTPGIDVSVVSPPGVPTPIYELAGNYAGRFGHPPPPTSSLEKLALTILGVVDKPRRKKRVGLVNPLTTTAFRLLPGVYDLLVTPLMNLAGLSPRKVQPHAGNVFETLPHPRPLEYRQGRDVGRPASVGVMTNSELRNGGPVDDPVQAVVDRVLSWQAGAPVATVRKELEEGLAKVGETRDDAWLDSTAERISNGDPAQQQG